MHTAQGLFLPVMLQGSADAFRVSVRVCYDDIEIDPSLVAEENNIAMWLGLCPAAFVASYILLRYCALPVSAIVVIGCLAKHLRIASFVC
jgi:hypothetical protein